MFRKNVHSGTLSLAVSTDVPATFAIGDDVALRHSVASTSIFGIAAPRPRPFFRLYAGRVVGAGLADFAVISEDFDAFVMSAANDLIEGRLRDRIEHDGVGTGLDYRVQLLDLVSASSAPEICTCKSTLSL